MKTRKMRMPKKVNARMHKRHAILLEVLIAFALVVMCALPLVYSHAYILRTQQELIQKIQLDHAVSLLYADLYERLQTNEISWDLIVNKTSASVDAATLSQYNAGVSLPYRGTYYFEVINRKPKGKEEPFTLNLLKLHLSFASEGSAKNHEYAYLIFAARRIGPDPAVQEWQSPEKNDPSGSLKNKNAPTAMQGKESDDTSEE